MAQVAIQHTLPFRFPSSYSFEDLWIGPANEKAVSILLGNGGLVSYKQFLLFADPGGGKSHLSSLWSKKERTDYFCFTPSHLDQEQETFHQYALHLLEHPPHCGIALDNASLLFGNSTSERALFHTINILKSYNLPLLLTLNTIQDLKSIQVPDLRSRLNSFLFLEIARPDNDLIFALLVKFCQERLLELEDEHLAFLVQNVPCSYAGIRQTMQQLDQESLRQKKRKLSKAFIKEILQNLDAKVY